MKRTKPADTEQEGAVLPSLSLFDNMADDTFVMVWRRDDRPSGTKKMVYAGRLGAGEATEEVIQQRLGGGHFLTRERVTNERGTQEWGRTRSFDLAGPMRWGGSLDAEEPAKPSGATPGVTVSGEPSPARQSVDAELARLLIDTAEASRKAIAESRPDPLVMLKPILDMQNEMMKNLMEQMRDLRAAANGGGGRKEIIEELTAMRKLVEPPVPATSPTSIIKEMVDGMRSLRGMGEELSPDRPPESGMSTLAAAVTPIVEIVREEQRLRREGTAPRGTVGPGPSPVVAPTPGTGPGSPLPPATQLEPAMPLWKRLLTERETALLQEAQNDTDPAQLAWLVWHYSTPEARASMQELLTSQPTVEAVGTTLMGEVPALAPYEDWTLALLEELMVQAGLIAEDDDGTGTASETDGDGGAAGGGGSSPAVDLGREGP